MAIQFGLVMTEDIERQIEEGRKERAILLRVKVEPVPSSSANLMWRKEPIGLPGFTDKVVTETGIMHLPDDVIWLIVKKVVEDHELYHDYKKVMPDCDYRFCTLVRNGTYVWSTSDLLQKISLVCRRFRRLMKNRCIWSQRRFIAKCFKLN